MGLQTVTDFLTEAKVFFFTTVDGTRPRTRPFGFFMEHGGKLYFGMGTHKAVWKQVLANPEIEVGALKPDNSWIRISGKAVVDSSAETLAAAFEKSPFLKTIYNDQSGLTMGLLWLKDGKAELNGPDNKNEEITF
jgi:uncharacterized pyridoxamine 5'-phosphate oxidase family protein